MALKLEPSEVRRLGEVGLTGWRKPVADAAASPASHGRAYGATATRGQIPRMRNRPWLLTYPRG